MTCARDRLGLVAERVVRIATAPIGRVVGERCVFDWERLRVWKTLRGAKVVAIKLPHLALHDASSEQRSSRTIRNVTGVTRALWNN